MAATQTWYYQQDSGVVGPLTSAELKRLIEQGVVRPATRIRRGRPALVPVGRDPGGA